MKSFIVLFLSIAVLSCKSSLKENENEVFEGNWVLKEVIDNTKTTRSVQKALELSDFYVSELVFDQNGDSVSVYNGQESYMRLPVQKENNRYTFQVRGNKASPILYDSEDGSLFFADSTLNRVYRFLKADTSFLNRTFEEAVAFPSYINNAMIEGKWTRGPNEPIIFGRFGSVSNWDDFNAYEIVVNGSFGKNTSGDLIILRSNDKQLLYGFKRLENAIQFFDLEADGENNYQHGKLLHEFNL